jgi:Tfp pilus assembly protein PilF
VTVVSLLFYCIAFNACVQLPERSVVDHAKALELIDAGVMQLEAGHIEQAHASFEMAFEQFPSATALDGLGCVALYKGDIIEAERLFQLALDMDSHYHHARGHLALVAELEGHFDQAEQLYREALLQLPDNTEVRINLAALLFSREKIDEARQELLRVNAYGSSSLVIENFRVTEKVGGDAKKE